MKKSFLFLASAFMLFCGCLVNCLAKDGAGVNLKFMDALSSTVTVAWNVNGCTDVEAAEYKYNIELYTSEDCTEESLFVSWYVEDPKVWSSDSGKTTRVRFTFSGLAPDTPYWVKVSVADDESLVSEPLAVRTAPFNFAVTAKEHGSAKVGDVLIAEDFSALVHGGDIAHAAAGAGMTGSKYRDKMRLPQGKNPAHLKVVSLSTEFNIFTSKGVTNEYTEATGLGDWCTGTGTNVSTRPGYAKIGAGDGGLGYLATPELSAIPDGKSVTVKVDFSAMPYYKGKSSQCEQILVGVVDKVKVDDHQVAKWTKEYDGANVRKGNFQYVPIRQDSDEFHDYSVTFSGVTNKSRIRFSSDRETDLSRFFLNYIVITVIEE